MAGLFIAVGASLAHSSTSLIIHSSIVGVFKFPDAMTALDYRCTKVHEIPFVLLLKKVSE